MGQLLLFGRKWRYGFIAYNVSQVKNTRSIFFDLVDCTLTSVPDFPLRYRNSETLTSETRTFPFNCISQRKYNMIRIAETTLLTLSYTEMAQSKHIHMQSYRHKGVLSLLPSRQCSLQWYNIGDTVSMWKRLHSDQLFYNILNKARKNVNEKSDIRIRSDFLWLFIYICIYMV